MRSVVLFLIGCVLGATAILLYLTETQQLAHAKPARGRVAETIVSGRPVPPAQTGVSVPHDSEPLVMPVEGISPERLKSTFDEGRGGGFRTHHAIDILAPRGTPVRAAVAGTIKKLLRAAPVASRSTSSIARRTDAITTRISIGTRRTWSKGCRSRRAM